MEEAPERLEVVSEPLRDPIRDPRARRQDPTPDPRGRSPSPNADPRQRFGNEPAETFFARFTNLPDTVSKEHMMSIISSAQIPYGFEQIKIYKFRGQPTAVVKVHKREHLKAVLALDNRYF